MSRSPVYSVLHTDSDVSSMSPGDIELNEMATNQWQSEIAATTDIMANPEADLLNRSSWLSCYINLTSTILGAGMLGLPYAYANLGWVLGAILIILCGIGAAFALYFLARCALKTSKPSSFYKVASMATPKYVFIIDLIIAIKCFGVATSYLIVVSDLMPLAIKHMSPASVFWHERDTWVVVGFCIVAPLSSLRSLDALRWTSGLSGFFLLFLIGLVVAYVNMYG